MWLACHYFQNCHHVTQLFYLNSQMHLSKNNRGINLKPKGPTEMDFFTSLCFPLCLFQKSMNETDSPSPQPRSSTWTVRMPQSVSRSRSGLHFYCGIGQEPKVQSIDSSQIPFDFLWKSDLDMASRIYVCCSTLYSLRPVCPL